MSERLTHKTLARYAVLGLPLGFIGLPLYVHLPKYYADTLPTSLAVIGAIMFFGRIFDCLADPWIGYLADRWSQRRRHLMTMASVTLAIGVVGLFQLPHFTTSGNAWIWLSILLVITYLSYSVLMIFFYAAGLGLSRDDAQTTSVSIWRESAIVIGVLIASALPPLLMHWVDEEGAYQLFSFVFVLVLVIAASIALRYLPKAPPHEAVTATWRALFSSVELRWIFALFFLNAIPTSITATLFLFFVSDILHVPVYSGGFLVLYFLSAVLSMPCWAWASKRVGKRRALMIAMGIAISSFVWAYMLGVNDVYPFVIICILSGIALGGDLSILPSLLADAINGKVAGGGLEFGIWNFISKFTLALAAGIALPLLYYLGYSPGSGNSAGLGALSFSYALLPCLFKCAALTLLISSPISQPRSLS